LLEDCGILANKWFDWRRDTDLLMT
jgi:hypothetical protein